MITSTEDSDTTNRANDVRKKLDDIVTNGIHVDKNLRQPSFYSSITYDELKVESFGIVCDLLSSQ